MLTMEMTTTAADITVILLHSFVHRHHCGIFLITVIVVIIILSFTIISVIIVIIIIISGSEPGYEEAGVGGEHWHLGHLRL